MLRVVDVVVLDSKQQSGISAFVVFDMLVDSSLAVSPRLQICLQDMDWANKFSFFYLWAHGHEIVGDSKASKSLADNMHSHVSRMTTCGSPMSGIGWEIRAIVQGVGANLDMHTNQSTYIIELEVIVMQGA